MPNAFLTSGSRGLTFKIATRGSPLALWQARWVQEKILKKYPEVSVELLNQGVYAKETHHSTVRFAPALTIKAWQI